MAESGKQRVGEGVGGGNGGEWGEGVGGGSGEEWGEGVDGRGHSSMWPLRLSVWSQSSLAP